MSPNSTDATGILSAANAFTFSRLLLLPIMIVGIVTGSGWLTVLGMLLVLLTDLLDGRIARRLGQSSSFGGTLDSTVDFVLIYSLFITFYAAGRLATYEFAFLYLAMLTILLVQLLSTATNAGQATPSTILGKLTGALQYGFLLFLAVGEVLPESRLLAWGHTGFFLVLAAAILLNTVGCVRAVLRMVRPR